MTRFDPTMPEAAARFSGWTVATAAFVVAVFGWGLGFYGPPVYLEAVRQERGWPVALVSGAVTVHFLAGVLVVANLPRLHRRFGLPLVTAAGAATLALGVLGWALARSPWQLYGAALVSGAGWVALGAAAVNAIVAPWFVRGRPAALGYAYNGASLGGVVLAPLWTLLIPAAGFPLAAAILGTLTVAVVGALAATVLAWTPQGRGEAPDGDRPDAGRAQPRPLVEPVARLGRDPAFLTLAGGMALALFAQVGLLAHLVSLLAPSLGPTGGGLAVSLATAAAILGRVLVGRLMPESAERRVVAALFLFGQASGSALVILGLFGAGPPALLLGVALVGLGIGNATSLPPLIAQAEFGAGDLPRAVALAVASAQGAYALAPVSFGLLRDAAGDAAAPAAALLVELIAAAVLLAGRGAHRRRAGFTDGQG